MVKIKEVNHGIASYYPEGNFIEVNKALKKYPSLYKSLIAHELRHSASNKKLDLKIELKDSLDLKTSFGLLKFSLKHPSALTQLSPVTRNHNGELSKDNFIILDYSFLILIIGVGLYSIF